MTVVGKLAIAIQAASLLWAGGCQPATILSPPESYRILIDRHNANVAAIEPFQSQVFDWSIKYTDEEGDHHTHQHLGGFVLYVPGERVAEPPSLYVRTAVPAIESQALVIGSNEKEYWMYSRLERKGRWGKYEYIGRSCVEESLIDPRILLKYIGFTALPDVPPDEYQVGGKDIFLRYVSRSEGVRQVWLEVVFSRYSNRPRSFRSYSRDGKLLIHSELGDYERINDFVLPGMVQFMLGEDDFALHLDLHSFKTIKRDDRKCRIFLNRPEGKRLEGLDEFRQVDYACEQEIFNDE